LPLTSHLSTIDVLDVMPGRALVIYSVEVEPASLAARMQASIDRGIAGLKQSIEADGVSS
jgi:hypothetical protein